MDRLTRKQAAQARKLEWLPIEDTRVSGKYATNGTRKAEVILAYSGNDPSSQYLVFTYRGGKPEPQTDQRYMSRADAYRVAKAFLK